MEPRKNPPTTSCAALEEELVLLHYGDLGGADKDRLTAHVAQCSGCAGYLKELASLLPLTLKSDAPPPEFWLDYQRELRHKIDDASATNGLRRWFTALLQPRYLPAFASVALVVLALTFTLGKNHWSGKNISDDELAETLPVAENLEFFSAMDVLDDLDLLDLLGSQSNNAA
ncbi:MAG: zf-HC2 domain-containing protein [Deltaproteobacteria bacterium]|nr:zf-HC2 domain-containing protein [Deltaproteobacteria bacterium]